MSNPSLRQSVTPWALLTEHCKHSGRTIQGEAQPACVQVSLFFDELPSGAVNVQGDRG